MIAGIYCRKSTDQNVADDAKSITRQLESGRAFAKSKGWTVCDDYVFVDDGISGAEFRGRAGYMRLLNAAGSHAPFSVLIVSELSRLGREQLETGFALKQLSQAGVAVWSYLEGKEIALTSAVDKFMMSAVSFAAEIEREKARARVGDAMQRRARSGYVTGGRLFGYTNVQVTDAAGRKSHTERRINAAEADVVRDIFQRATDGHGLKRIAKDLNASGALAPKSCAGRPHGWAPSSVRGVLHRRTYLGEIRYGMTAKRDVWGQRKTRRRPAAEVLVVPQPEWTIIGLPLWAAAHARIAATRETYSAARGTDNRNGHPLTGLRGRYLLSGLAACSVCGGSMAAHCTTQDGRSWRYYKCSSYHNRGVCRNGLPARLDVADRAVLAEVARFLSSDIFEGAIADAIAELRAPGNLDTSREALTAEQRRITDELQRYADAIATAGNIDALVKAMADREQRRVAIQRQLTALDRSTRASLTDVGKIEKALRGKLQDWRTTFLRHAPLSRQLLMRLLDEKLRFTPDADSRSYRFAGKASPGGLISGLVAESGDLPKVWCARRGAHQSVSICGIVEAA